MATSYTQKLLDNPDMSPRAFALLCARAFGALVHMREYALDADIPESVPVDTYHLDQLRLAEAKARELETMTVDEATLRARSEHEAAVAAARQYDAKARRENDVLNAMAARVESMRLPESHRELKDFMLRQLLDSRHSAPFAVPTLRTGEQWLAHARERSAWELGYHAEGWAQELKRSAERNAWLRALREALPKEER